MLLLVFLVIGLLAGMFRGGGLSGLLRIRGLWLILVSFAAERLFMFLPELVPQMFPTLTMIIQLARFLPLFAFILLNVKNWRVCVMGLGIALNFAAIAANGWRMPISWEAPMVQGLAGYVSHVQTGGMPEYMVMGGYAGANLWFFSDIIPLNFIQAFPMGYLSVGDVLLGVGLMLTVQHGMARHSAGRHVRGSHAKHLGGKPGKPRHVAVAMQHAAAGGTIAEAAKKRPFARDIPKHPEVAVSPEPRLEPEYKPEYKPEYVPEPERVPEYKLESEPEYKSEYLSEYEPEPARPPVSFDPQQASPDSFPATELSQREPELLETVPVQEFAGREADLEEPAFGDSTVKLSPRLEAVAGLVTRRAVVADVGCDHGKLAAWLAMNGAVFVVATDVSAKSLSKTKKLVNELGLQHAVQTRVGDGLRRLKAGEADVIVIAGMGGPTICSILKNGYNVAESAARLVLQPMNAVGEVRRWLTDNGFRIVAEQLAGEDGRIYQVLAAEPGPDNRPPMSLFDMEVGHLLIENRHPLLPKLLESKISTIDKILAELAGNNTPKADARRNELVALKDRCAEVLESL